MNRRVLYAGIDVGSTTVKIALLNPINHELLYHKYLRHNAEQVIAVYDLLTGVHSEFSEFSIIPIVCGSGSIELSRVLDAFYIQEVVALSIIVRRFYSRVRTAIELGGQDAKLIFFDKDIGTGNTVVNDMRMNGSCAGGTGAFIDQVAELLDISPEEFGSLSKGASTVYDISGRCGVFAKTDIQPLLNQGVPKKDIALSTFHAIAKQTIGGLAQGLTMKGPVIFVGGPLTFNPDLIRVFSEKLKLSEEDIIIPEHPEIFVAQGAAISIDEMHGESENKYKKENLNKLKEFINTSKETGALNGYKFFDSQREMISFRNKNRLPVFVPYYDRIEPNLINKNNINEKKDLWVYLGIDAGSTTSKFVMLDRDGEIIEKFYGNNKGVPLSIIRNALLDSRDRFYKKGFNLHIIGAGSTGYGEKLFASAFCLDYHAVETVAHTRAAFEECPDVSFILDIGGQDMKAIYVDRGVPVNFVLNEACSAGCGSFLETYAAALNVSTNKIADIAFEADHPSRLGSRCTVFMNSSIITEQKNGRSLAEILAGLCYSVVENAVSKVLRISNYDLFGDNIVVQGGTFKNDAVLKAFQQKIGKNTIRPPYPGEMGAIGIALLTKEFFEKEGQNKKESSFSWEILENFSYRKLPAAVCPFCSNSCSRTVIEFSEGEKFVTGNRCEKGEIVADPGEKSVKEKLRAVSLKMKSIPDLPALREKLLVKNYSFKQVDEDKNVAIGIPRVLEFWDSLPFWKTFFRALGYRVIISALSSYKIFESGLSSVSSDTICLPAKIAHGHILDLVEKKADRIFNPLMLKGIPENKNAADSWMCPVIQGYGEVIRIHDDPEKNHNIKLDVPPFCWDTEKVRNRQIVSYGITKLGLEKRNILKAIKEADGALSEFRKTLIERGRDTIEMVKARNEFAVILAGRPYHNDSFINHDLARHFTSLGIPVLDLDALPGLNDVDLSGLMIEPNNAFHTRLLAASILTAKHTYLEMVQVVSFGCGHDAIISDEIERLMKTIGDKRPLILKMDEGENRGPVSIRVRSFIESIKNQKSKQQKEKIPVLC